MRLAIISLGGESSRMILKEASSLFDVADSYDIRRVYIEADSKNLKVMYDGKELEEYDCVYIRGSFKYVLLQRTISSILRDRCYLPVRAKAFSIGHDKLLTLLELQKAGVSIPKTYLAAKTKTAKKLLEEVNYPIIMKIPGGTQGKGVMSADSLSSAKSFLDTLEVFKQPYIIQEYIETDAEDIRAIVTGNKVVASMKRKAMGGSELRANIHLGGVGVKYNLSPNDETLAITAAKAIGVDIAGVDLLEGVKGGVVIEINLSPGLRGITAATKRNVAADIAKFLFKKTEAFKNKKKESSYTEITKELKDDRVREVVTNLDIKFGKIRLPELVTKVTKFNSKDKIVLVMDEGKLAIKRYEE